MRAFLGTTALVLIAGQAFGAGLDRSGQSTSILYEEGRWAELSFGFVTPDVTGTDALAQPTGNVGENYTLPSMAYKADFDDQISYAFIIDTPYGGNVAYGATSPLYAGTTGEVDSRALTALLQYNLDGGFSVHGGLRALQTTSDVTLSGAAYGATSGYNYTGESDWEMGYVVGVAYERPEIAARASLTYSTAIDLTMASVENNPNPALGAIAGVDVPGDFDVEVPASVNLDLQMGIMEDTLMFGSIRYVEWDGFNLTPALLNGGSLVEYDKDRFTFSAGIGRRFSDTVSGAITVGYEPEADGTSGALGPTNGYWSLGVGGTYTMPTGVEFTGGARYILPGDADVASGGGTAAFTDNSGLAFGIKIGMPL